MRIIAVTDIHGDPAGIVRLKAELARADLALVSGDITNFGGRREAAVVMEKIHEYCPRILAVPGNCDRPEVGAYLSEHGWNLDSRAVELEGLRFLGLGGSLPCPGRTLLEFTEEELASFLNGADSDSKAGTPFVLLCHQPPYGTKLDRVFGGLHVGSRAIREFIVKQKPLACFCGHIHESAGMDNIGATVIANPGPLAKRGYVLCRWKDGEIKVEINRI